MKLNSKEQDIDIIVTKEEVIIKIKNKDIQDNEDKNEYISPQRSTSISDYYKNQS